MERRGARPCCPEPAVDLQARGWPLVWRAAGVRADGASSRQRDFDARGGRKGGVDRAGRGGRKGEFTATAL